MGLVGAKEVRKTAAGQTWKALNASAVPDRVSCLVFS